MPVALPGEPTSVALSSACSGHCRYATETALYFRSDNSATTDMMTTIIGDRQGGHLNSMSFVSTRSELSARLDVQLPKDYEVV